MAGAGLKSLNQPEVSLEEANQDGGNNNGQHRRRSRILQGQIMTQIQQKREPGDGLETGCLDAGLSECIAAAVVSI